MKKILFLFAFIGIASIGFSQTVHNNTTSTIEVSGEYIPSGANGCSGATTINFGPVTVLPTGSYTGTPPTGYKVGTIGICSGPGVTGGYERVHCAAGSPIVCESSSGGYTFNWTSCNTVEIY